MRITVSVLSPPRIKQTSLEKLLGISLPVHVRASNFFSFTEKPRGIFFLPFPSPASISCETSPASRTSIPSVRRKYCNAPAKISTTRKACVRIKPTPRSVITAVRNPVRFFPWISVPGVFAGMLLIFLPPLRARKKHAV